MSLKRSRRSFAVSINLLVFILCLASISGTKSQWFWEQRGRESNEVESRADVPPDPDTELDYELESQPSPWPFEGKAFTDMIIPASPVYDPELDGCGPNHFFCANGSCIDLTLRCNGLFDCSHGEDEEYCGCLSSQNRCSSGGCVDKAKYCDGRKDCEDGSDESDCYENRSLDMNRHQITTASTTAPKQVISVIRPYGNSGRYDPKGIRCLSDQYTCSSGQCIDTFLVCDGRQDCWDGSDENGCKGTLVLKVYDTPQTAIERHDVVFRCRDEGPLRIPVYWERKDGGRFFPGTIDKEGRLSMYKIDASASGVYVCRTKRYPDERLAYLNVVPDTDPVIPFVPRPVDPYVPRPVDPYVPRPVVPEPEPITKCRSHEIGCQNGECILRSKICDTFYDCLDRSDEAYCPMRCESHQFRCNSGQCVQKDSRCNGIKDCGDFSDENNCRSHWLPCRYNEFYCDLKCIPIGYVCDRLRDCRDGSDESGCVDPTFVRPPPKMIEVFEGESVTIECHVAGYPLPAIGWRFNLEPISQSPKITFCFTCDSRQCDPKAAFSSMTIRSVSNAEQGTWICQANNILSPFDTQIIVKSRTNYN